MRGGSRTAATSKAELFVIIVNGWKSLTIIIKSSTLDVAAVLDPPLIIGNILKTNIFNNSLEKSKIKLDVSGRRKNNLQKKASEKCLKNWKKKSF